MPDHICFAVRADEEYRAKVRREAFKRGMMMGDFLRRAIDAGISALNADPSSFFANGDANLPHTETSLHTHRNPQSEAAEDRTNNGR